MARMNLAIRQPVAVAAYGNPCATCEIREIGVCGSLQHNEIGELRQIIKESEAPTGRMVFAEGEPADNLYNVVSGAVRLTKLLPDGRRQITGFMFPGDFLGIAFNESYAYSAEAIVATRLCRFPRRSLERLVDSSRSFERRLLGEAASELAAAQDQMLLLGRKTAQERVATFLLDLSARARRRGRIDNPVTVPMSRTDIADYLGLTTETVSRCFTKLRTARVIHSAQPGFVAILDAPQLAVLAQSELPRSH